MWNDRDMPATRVALPALAAAAVPLGVVAYRVQVDNLPPDHLTRRTNLINAVKIDDVRRLARRLLREDVMTTVVVGKPVGVTADP